jgi:hypothetical protein
VSARATGRQLLQPDRTEFIPRVRIPPGVSQALPSVHSRWEEGTVRTEKHHRMASLTPWLDRCTTKLAEHYPVACLSAPAKTAQPERKVPFTPSRTRLSRNCNHETIKSQAGRSSPTGEAGMGRILLLVGGCTQSASAGLLRELSNIRYRLESGIAAGRKLATRMGKSTRYRAPTP